MDITKKLKKLLSNLRLKKKFKKHNQVFFSKKYDDNKDIILVELNKLCEIHIMYSYLSNILAEKFKAKIIGYNSRFFLKFKNLIFFSLKRLLNLDYFAVYKSFNTSEFIYPKKKKIDKPKINQIFHNLKNKKDLMQIEISSVRIGDLLYDAYLRKYNLPTLNIKDKQLIKFAYEFFSLFDFWENYLNTKSVKAVIIGDTTYEYGIISRLSIFKNIPTYIGGPTRLHCLNKNNINVFEMKNYRQEFNLYSEKEKDSKINFAKELVEKRFLGKRTVENLVSNLPDQQLFGKVKFNKKVIVNNKKINCLVAAHHFSDAPHAWGDLLFNDFFEWTDYLGKLSNELDYDWYIKLHPLDFKENEKTIEYFLKKYENFKLIPRNTSHTQLISEGIDLVLTVFGTIGFEYAYYSIPVINASLNNPHIDFDFNHNPKSITDYKDSIINFKKLDFNFDKKQFYEYYYMRYVNNFYLFSDEISQSLKKSLDAFDDHSELVYKRWFNLFSEEEHKKLNLRINNFFNTGNYRYKKDEFIL
jgi:hypothetical protein